MSARQGDLARRVENNTAAVREAPTADRQVADLIKAQLPRIKTLLPDVFSETALAGMVMNEIRTQPKLAICTPESLVGCVLRVAQLGLHLGPDLGEAWLIARNDRERGMECTMQLGYRGIIRLAERSGRLASMTTRSVYECDEFEYAYGLEERLHHVPGPAEQRTADRLTHAYAVARYTNGGRDWEVLSRHEIEARRARGKGAQPAWRTDYAKMAEKSAVLAMRARLPLAPEVAQAFAQDGAAITPATHGPPALEAHHAEPEPVAIEPPTGEVVGQGRRVDGASLSDAPQDDAAADPEPEHAASPIGDQAGATVHRDLGRLKVPKELHAAIIAKASRGRTIHASQLNPSEAALAVDRLAADCVKDPSLFAAQVLGQWGPDHEPEARAALATWLEAQT